MVIIFLIKSLQLVVLNIILIKALAEKLHKQNHLLENLKKTKSRLFS